MIDTPSRTHRTQLVPSVARAVAILDLVGQRGNPLTLDEIVSSLRLPKSSTLAICRTLVAEGLLLRNEAGRYSMGLRTVELARASLRGYDLVAAFDEALERQPAPPETVQLAVARGTEVLFLSRRDGPQPVRLSSAIGIRLPASTTAVGKAMLACHDNTYVRAIFSGSVFPRLTDHSHQRIETLLTDIEAIRDRGYAIDDQETLDGVICVGVAVRDFASGLPTGAVSATLLKPREGDDRLSSAVAFLQLLVEDMSSLAGRPGRPTGELMPALTR